MKTDVSESGLIPMGGIHIAAILALFLAGTATPVTAGFSMVMADEIDCTYDGVPFGFPDTGSWSVIHRPGTFVPTSIVDLEGYSTDTIHILQCSGYADNVPDGVVIGHVFVVYGDSTSTNLDLVIGINTAEWAYDRPEIQPYLQHTKIPAAYSWWTNNDSSHYYWGHQFYVSIELDPKPLSYLELVLDPAAYTGQKYYGFAHADTFAIDISAVTLESAAIPVPGAVLLGAIGTGFVGWLRRRRAI